MQANLAAIGRMSGRRGRGPARSGRRRPARPGRGSRPRARSGSRPGRRPPGSRAPRISSTTSPIGTSTFGKTADSSRPTIMRIRSARLTSAHRPRAHARAVAQDGDAVGDLKQLFQPVRDVDDADALRPQLADHPEQMLHLAVAERRGRLVHDQDAGLGPERPGDLDKLLLRHGQAGAPRSSGSMPAPIALEQLRARARRAGASGPAARRRRLQAQRDVLGHRQVREERRLLVDRGDAQPAGP